LAKAVSAMLVIVLRPGTLLLITASNPLSHIDPEFGQRFVGAPSEVGGMFGM